MFLTVFKTKYEAVVAKLKTEWKTFALAIATTVTGAWELASQWGVDVPSFFNWVPEKYRSALLFAIGLGFLLLRKYTPTVALVEAPTVSVVEVAQPEAPVELKP